MINRVAFFTKKKEIENFFGIETRQEYLFDPHYNIPPGWQLPVIHNSSEKKLLDISRVRWGSGENTAAENTTLQKEELDKSDKIKNAKRIIVPLSGFYVWKDPESKGHPFFVRMLNYPFMAIAGLWFKNSRDFMSMVTTESNPLIQPMSEQMPLLLNRQTAMGWLDENQPTADVIEKSESLYLLTDLSVMRVSKKVNDLTNNNPEMIQPIPK